MTKSVNKSIVNWDNDEQTIRLLNKEIWKRITIQQKKKSLKMRKEKTSNSRSVITRKYRKKASKTLRQKSLIGWPTSRWRQTSMDSGKAKTGRCLGCGEVIDEWKWTLYCWVCLKKVNQLRQLLKEQKAMRQEMREYNYRQVGL